MSAYVTFRDAMYNALLLGKFLTDRYVSIICGDTFEGKLKVCLPEQTKHQYWLQKPSNCSAVRAGVLDRSTSHEAWLYVDFGAGVRYFHKCAIGKSFYQTQERDLVVSNAWIFRVCPNGSDEDASLR